MKACLFFILFVLSAKTGVSQYSSQNYRQFTNQPVQLSFGDYIHEHFEIGAGLHTLLILPGAHAKLRYAPINSNRFKLMGEVRGELFLAPLAGWNYNVQIGTSFRGDVGLHAGFGRSQYVAGIRTDTSEKLNRIFQNTFEIGLSTNILDRRFDVYLSLPMHTDYFPVIIAGVSITGGKIWNLRSPKIGRNRHKKML